MDKNDAGPTDLIEAQSFTLQAEAKAKIFVDQYGNDFNAIEKAVKRLKAPKEFIDEILWAVRWLLQSLQPT